MSGELLTVFETGTGARVEVIPLAAGDTFLPARASILVTALSAKNALTVAVTITTLIASRTIRIPSGTTFPFLDPLTGATKIATLTAEVLVTTAGTAPFNATTTFAVMANHEPIAINSTSSNYIRLGARTSGESSIKINDEGLSTFDSAFFKQSQIISGEGEIKCSGAYSSVDAGIRTVESQTKGLRSLDNLTEIAPAGRNLWVLVTTAAPTSAFLSGTVIRCICLCTDLSIKVEAGKITTQDLPFKVNGTIYTDPPLVA